MGDTSIRISDELADELYDRKNRGESYEDVIWRLISNEHNSDSPSE
jgi:predicted CopG family antitoxin